LVEILFTLKAMVPEIFRLEEDENNEPPIESSFCTIAFPVTSRLYLAVV
jgi:hypothetical protein